ncbi:MAG: hypothetical protein E6Z40_11305, partial [Bifidobacterium sp.]|nr:hypothetical protein [Bifidobacterium sp.]
MQVSFTAHTPAHSPLTIQQRLEAAGFTNVHVNAISDTVEPFTRTNPETIQAYEEGKTHGSTLRPLRRHERSPTHQPLPRRRPITHELDTSSRMPRPRPRTLVQHPAIQ